MTVVPVPEGVQRRVPNQRHVRLLLAHLIIEVHLVVQIGLRDEHGGIHPPIFHLDNHIAKLNIKLL